MPTSLTWFCIPLTITGGSSILAILANIKSVAFAFNTITRSAFKNQESEISPFLCPVIKFTPFIQKQDDQYQEAAKVSKEMAENYYNQPKKNHTDSVSETSSCSSSSKIEKGHFVVYSADQKRFVLPLQYLNNEMMRELFDMAEDEFGLCVEGPLTLPCEAKLMEYAIALIKQKVNRDVQKALLTSMASSCASFHLQHQSEFNQLPICSF